MKGTKTIKKKLLNISFEIFSELFGEAIDTWIDYANEKLKIEVVKTIDLKEEIKELKMQLDSDKATIKHLKKQVDDIEYLKRQVDDLSDKKEEVEDYRPHGTRRKKSKI